MEFKRIVGEYALGDGPSAAYAACEVRYKDDPHFRLFLDILANTEAGQARYHVQADQFRYEYLGNRLHVGGGAWGNFVLLAEDLAPTPRRLSSTAACWPSAASRPPSSTTPAARRSSRRASGTCGSPRASRASAAAPPGAWPRG